MPPWNGSVLVEIADTEPYIWLHRIIQNSDKLGNPQRESGIPLGGITRFTATLDHVTPVAEGGDNSFDNLLTACLSCNSQKNVRPVGDFIADKNPS